MKLIKNDGETSIYKLSDGRQVKFEIDYGSGINIHGEVNGAFKKIGYLQFNETEHDCGNGHTIFVHKLTHAFLEGDNGSFQRNGVATKAFCIYYDYNEQPPLEFPKNDGLRHDDGSHMTTDGVNFVEHLKALYGHEDEDSFKH